MQYTILIIINIIYVYYTVYTCYEVLDGSVGRYIEWLMNKVGCC